MLKTAFANIPNVSLLAFPDKKIVVKGGQAAAPAPAPTAAPAPDPMARYNRGRPPQQPVAPAPVAVAPEPEVLPKFGADGAWDEEAGRYAVTLHDPAGKEVKGTAQIKGDEMLMSIGGANLIFAKQ